MPGFEDYEEIALQPFNALQWSDQTPITAAPQSSIMLAGQPLNLADYGSVSINVGGLDVPAIKLCSNGDIYIRGALIENDLAVVEGFRAFLTGQGLYREPQDALPPDAHFVTTVF